MTIRHFVRSALRALRTKCLLYETKMWKMASLFCTKNKKGRVGRAESAAKTADNYLNICFPRRCVYFNAKGKISAELQKVANNFKSCIYEY